MSAFTFTGPEGQTVAYAHGAVVCRGVPWGMAEDHRAACWQIQPVQHLGPYGGGRGPTDALSAYLAGRMVLHSWAVTGQIPDLPFIPTPPGEGIDFVV